MIILNLNIIDKIYDLNNLEIKSKIFIFLALFFFQIYV